MSPSESPVVVIVLFKTTHSTDALALRELLEKAGPKYTSIPHLQRKYFISSEGIGGGIYEWSSRSHALSFYDQIWRVKAIEQFGSEPKITFYDVAAVANGLKQELEIFL